MRFIIFIIICFLHIGCVSNHDSSGLQAQQLSHGVFEYSKDESSKWRVEYKNPKYYHYYNADEWQLYTGSSEEKIIFYHNEYRLQATIFWQPDRYRNDILLPAFIEALKENRPMFKLLRQEKRTVNGINVDYIVYTYNFEEDVIVASMYLTTGKEGTAWAMVESYKEDYTARQYVIERFLNGVSINDELEAIQ